MPLLVGVSPTKRNRYTRRRAQIAAHGQQGRLEAFAHAAHGAGENLNADIEEVVRRNGQQDFAADFPHGGVPR